MREVEGFSLRRGVTFESGAPDSLGAHWRYRGIQRVGLRPKLEDFGDHIRPVVRAGFLEPL